MTFVCTGRGDYNEGPQGAPGPCHLPGHCPAHLSQSWSAQSEVGPPGSGLVKPYKIIRFTKRYIPLV